MGDRVVKGGNLHCSGFPLVAHRSTKREWPQCERKLRMKMIDGHDVDEKLK